MVKFFRYIAQTLRDPQLQLVAVNIGLMALFEVVWIVEVYRHGSVLTINSFVAGFIVLSSMINAIGYLWIRERSGQNSRQDANSNDLTD